LKDKELAKNKAKEIFDQLGRKRGKEYIAEKLSISGNSNWWIRVLNEYRKLNK